MFDVVIMDIYRKPPQTATLENGVEYALDTIHQEAQALLHMREILLDQKLALSQALSLIIEHVNRGGHVVVTGMGKSGHIGRKISATMASTGTPSLFLHPAEALHGDLGMVGKYDLVIAISHSGESQEILALLPALKRLNVPLITICNKASASLSRAADIALTINIEQEACPHNLAPTSSTTAQLALGDALALGVLVAQGFSADDFSRVHPGGALGKRLLKVSDIMHQGRDIPMVKASDSLAKALQEMTRGRLGTTVVVDDPQSETPQILGVFTDGDLRRITLSGKLSINDPICEVMHAKPFSIHPHVLAAEAVAMMESHRINQILVVNDHQALLGIINMHDLLQHRVL